MPRPLPVSVRASPYAGALTHVQVASMLLVVSACLFLASSFWVASCDTIGSNSAGRLELYSPKIGDCSDPCLARCLSALEISSNCTGNCAFRANPVFYSQQLAQVDNCSCHALEAASFAPYDTDRDGHRTARGSWSHELSQVSLDTVCC